MLNYIISVEEYLQQKFIKTIRDEGKELVIHCLFSGCDNDSKGSEAHLYVEKATGMYHCKKCNAQGNLIKLRKHFGDITTPSNSLVRSNRNFTQSLIEECASNLPDRIRKYLNDRGVNDEMISKYKIGYGNFYGYNWITIPMWKPGEVEYSFLYLRKDPENKNESMPKNLSFPKGKGEVILFGEYAKESEDLIITEGIMDCISLLSQGHKAVTSTGGCMTFKDDWVTEELLKARNIYVAYDRDEPGDKGAEMVLKKLKEAKYKNLYKVTLPEIVGNKGDVNDYIAKHKLQIEDLKTKYSEPYPKQIDVRDFKEIGISELDEVLSLTIKNDYENKILTFLGFLSTYTHNMPLNIMLIGQSSSGKTYIATSCSKFFPKEDMTILGQCSPTAFHHKVGKYDKETNTMTTDFKNKIIVFTESQSPQVLEKLRSLLSHDLEETNSSITDKSEKSGNRTKNTVFKHYPSVIYCSTNLKSDGQEKTRFLNLSPIVTDEKVRAGVINFLDKAEDEALYKEEKEEIKMVTDLKNRILAIKNEEIQNIKINKDERNMLESYILVGAKSLDPRKQRDVKYLTAIAMTLALLNLWFRNHKDKTITVDRKDVLDAIKLFEYIKITQELNISPFVYNYYNNVIKPLYKAKNNLVHNLDGLSYMDILKGGSSLGGKKIDYNYLRQQIIPELEAAGLVEKVQMGTKVEVHITEDTTYGSEIDMNKLSSEIEGGVKNQII
jgi:Toprim-like